MTLLSLDEIIKLHEKLIQRTGGTQGIRDKALLESAVFSCEASFDDVELYCSIQEKAARLCYAITNNHAFVDGNKRIGILTMLMTLKLNDVQIKYKQSELIELGLCVADGTFGYEEVLLWINSH